MTDMQNSNDNQNDFAIIHVRPGLEGKEQPVGTLAVNLPAAAVGELIVGYAIQHSKLDAWNGARGRMVAVGRASRVRDSAICAPIARGTMRRELLIAALELIEANNDTLNLSRGFRSAVSDTLTRLLEAKAAADLKRAQADAVGSA
jgi:hypothetical protein